MKAKTGKKVDDLVTLFSELREKSIKAGEKVENIRWEFLREVYNVPGGNKLTSSSSISLNKVIWFILLPAVVVFLGLSVVDLDSTSPCLVDTEMVFWNEITRKPSECSKMCVDVAEVPRVSNLSKKEFIANYAYNGHPVVITDAAQNWSAVGKFSFNFFKRLYANNMEAAENFDYDQGCIFFAYNSGFENLAQVLRMPKKRAEWKGKPWYIGCGIWSVFAYSSHRSHGYVNYVMLRRGTCTFSFVMIAYQADLATEREPQLTTVRANQTAGLTNGKAAKSNCDPVIREKLRNYYSKPAFIPDDAETGDQDWIFMGGPGPGAPIHLDMVNRPSWQAQLSGQKIWTLVPPPECEHVCRAMNVTINKGDIIVLDTNQWYHSTKIVPTGELSITIGAEYD
ncbi:unnamed protein product [Porites lobata]|uniref:JmjC domain-containing protein n=1 Tax=Porites lobata TaxID=104759 RepID=A0ABN8QHE2_9CNID|nr:unnamed protein product [Porites lobata]